MVGLGGFEPPTPALSRRCSNQLSYRPFGLHVDAQPISVGARTPGNFSRKEVIQPHLPVRLPCYDFVPIASPTFDGSLPQGVGPPASGVTDFRGVTGGVYKARERIHPGVLIRDY